MANKNSCTYKIVTDSTSDLTPKLVEELDVEVIPMEFIFGDEVYHNYPDAREMSSKEFYGRLRAGEMSKTNQINTVTFLETFEPYLREGLDVLYIGFSSSLSAHTSAHSKPLNSSGKNIRAAGSCRSIPWQSPWARACSYITPPSSKKPELPWMRRQNG